MLAVGDVYTIRPQEVRTQDHIGANIRHPQTRVLDRHGTQVEYLERRPVVRQWIACYTSQNARLPGLPFVEAQVAGNQGGEDRLIRAGVQLGIGVHSPQFVHLEQPAILSDAELSEDDRPSAGQLDD